MRASILALLLGLAGTAAADPPPPTVATRALLRDLVRGAIPWRDVIDPARGVTFVGYTSTEDDPPTHRWSRHRCGAAAVRELARRHDDLARWIQADEAFACHNRPGPPTCELGEAGEFMSTLRFVFRRADDGHLVLDHVATVNSVYAPSDEAPVLRRLVARQAAATCP